MKRIIRLTESDLTRIVKRVIMEQGENPLAFATDPNNMDYAGFNKSSKPDDPIISNSDLASAGYTDTNNEDVGFFNFMDNEGFKIIDKSENIDDEIENTDGFKPRYKKNIGDLTIYVILKLKTPRETSRIAVYDSEGFVGGEDIKNIEEKGEDPKWGSFISYKIDYDGIMDSFSRIYNKYGIADMLMKESYRRRYRRY